MIIFRENDKSAELPRFTVDLFHGLKWQRKLSSHISAWESALVIDIFKDVCRFTEKDSLKVGLVGLQLTYSTNTETLFMCLFNVGPPSTTLAQH